MSIKDLFSNNFIQANKDHFASIVRVAMSDNVITDEEKTFLDRLARKLDITDDEFKTILKDYNTHPINPPFTYERRLERLFDLGRMVYADNELGEKQPKTLERLAVGLGFNAHNAMYIVDKALALISNGVDLDTFSEEIRNMNR